MEVTNDLLMQMKIKNRNQRRTYKSLHRAYERLRLKHNSRVLHSRAIAVVTFIVGVVVGIAITSI